MKEMRNAIFSLAALLLTCAAPAWADGGAVRQSLSVGGERVGRTVSEITLDGNNAVLLFADGGSLTVDMQDVELTLTYGDATGISGALPPDGRGQTANDKAYDLGGRPVSGQTASGVRIVNGKKYFTKNNSNP